MMASVLATDGYMPDFLFDELYLTMPYYDCMIRGAWGMGPTIFKRRASSGEAGPL